MRDYLRAHSVEFDERNIRQSADARTELRDRTGALVVPVLIFEDDSVVGFEPEAIDRVIEAYRSMAGS